MNITNEEYRVGTRINIKPLSVNTCWQGKRYKTEDYKAYEKSVLFMLPKLKLQDPPYRLILEFGLSNVLSDLDNPVKPFVDILQKKYGFNDKLIMEANIKKVKTGKGKEYILFDIQSI